MLIVVESKLSVTFTLFLVLIENTTAESTDPPQRMTRQQILTLISIASVNFSSMICYSILGPFFPNEVRSNNMYN